MKWLMQLVALALLLACGTWFGGWWLVPVTAALYGAWAFRQRSAVLTAGFAGALAWGALLLVDAAQGPMGRLLDIFHGLFRVSGGMIAFMTMAYAALLGASAAALARTLRRLAAPV